MTDVLCPNYRLCAPFFTFLSTEGLMSFLAGEVSVGFVLLTGQRIFYLGQAEKALNVGGDCFFFMDEEDGVEDVG